MQGDLKTAQAELARAEKEVARVEHRELLREFRSELEAFQDRVREAIAVLAGEAAPLFELKSRVESAAGQCGQGWNLGGHVCAESIILEVAEQASSAAVQKAIRLRRTA